MEITEEERKEGRRYLLGEGDEEDRARIENRSFSDPEYFDQLVLMEDALIDEYVRGGLKGAAKASFEQRLASSNDWRERVEFARALHSSLVAKRTQGGLLAFWRLRPFRAAASGPGTSRRPLRFTVVAATAVVAILVTIGLGVSTIVLTSRLRSVEAERNALRVAADEAVRERAQQSEPAGPPNDAQKDRPVDVSPRQANGPPRRVMSFVLATGIARSDSDPGTTLKVPVSTDVQLRLELPPEAAATPVRATLQTVDGVELWVQDGIPAERVDDRRVAIVTVPAETVPAGDYLLMLQAGSTTPETVASYFFRIARP